MIISFESGYVGSVSLSILGHLETAGGYGLCVCAFLFEVSNRQHRVRTETTFWGEVLNVETGFWDR